ncbi:MAG: DUF2975 domain-containing protein [Ruminococcaceae bacterium]|nr:DUF2975 domain-containing protein [Oscillospiraceae bacterium]
MKNFKRSTKILFGVLIFLSVVFGVLLFLAPMLFQWYCSYIGRGTESYKILVLVFYLCSPSAAATLIFLFKFLFQIKSNEIFSKETTKILSILSWCCLSIVPLSLPLCTEFLASLPIPAAGFFMWLFLTVIKNAFEYGAELKDENDLTV